MQSDHPPPTASSSRARSPTPPSRDRSRSPSSTTHSRPRKRASTFSPVPEESPATLPSTSIPSDHDTSAASSSKRPRVSGAADPEKKRGRRMLGLLNSTLTRFQQESASDRTQERRAEVQARLERKLRAAERDEERRLLIWDARRVAEKIAERDAQRRVVRRMKRRMASFLFTKQEERGERERGRLAPKIPMSVRAEERGKAVYFLPGKTLPEQEDRLNEQEDEVDELIDAFDDNWEEERKRLVAELETLKGLIRSL